MNLTRFFGSKLSFCAISLGVIVLACVNLYAVPKFFFVKTYGTPDGAQYDAQRNLIYVSSPQTSQVLAADATTGQVRSSLYVPNAAGMDITPDGKQLVVGTTAGGGWFGDTFLTFIDLDTFTVAAQIPIDNPMQLGSGGQSAVYSPYIRRVVALSNGNILFTAAPQGTTETWIGEYKPAAGTFSLIAMGGGTLIRSNDHRYVLLPNMGFNFGMEIFDANADAITISNPGLLGTGVAFSHDGKLVSYSVDQHSTLILDATTLQPIQTIATPTAGFQSAFSPDNSTVYIQVFATPVFYAFDVTTGLVKGDFAIPGDDHDNVNLLGIDSRGMLYSSLDRGLAVTDSSVLGFFPPQSQFAGTAYPYVASPSAGPISGGTPVTIAQHHLANATVYFADKTASITGTDSTGITVITPPGDRSGPVDITVKYDDGFVSYIPEGFSYGPSIEYLDHNGGTSAGGDTLTLFALGLRSASTAGIQVTIGGAPATITSVTVMGISPIKTPTYRIALATPNGTVGAADVVLTTQDGSARLQGGFNYLGITDLGGATTVSHMLYDDSRGYLYRCNYGSNEIDVLDTATEQFIKNYSTHLTPIAMALSPDRSTLYVTTAAGFIDIINLNSGAWTSIKPTLPSGMTMTRIGVTSKGTLFVGIYNPAVITDSRLIEVDPSTGSFTTRLQNFNGNYLEIGLSRDGTHAFISADLASGASGSTLYYWDAFTDTFRQEFVPGWEDYGADDAAALFVGGQLTYDTVFDVHNALQTFDFDTDILVFGEKLDDSGALQIQPSLNSVSIFDVHHGTRIARINLLPQVAITLDAVALDSFHNAMYISSVVGLLKVPLPNILAIGRLEPAQGLTTGGQTITIRGIGFEPHATVTIGGQPASSTFENATTLRVTTPALPLGPATVQVTNDDGGEYTLPAAYSAVNTQPMIIGTSPTQLRISGGFSFLPISVIGMGFAPDAVVLWNGSSRSTYFVDDTQLDVDLNPSDTNSPGAAMVTVRNPDGGLSNQITVPIRSYPQVTLPSPFSFAPQIVNTSSAIQNGTVTNSGSDQVNLSFSVASPFAVTSNCPSALNAGASCTLSVGFNPAAPGTYNSSIIVSGDMTGNITLTGVAGFATPTLGVSPARVTFPAGSPESEPTVSVLITNSGVSTVTVNQVSIDSNDFSEIYYGGPTLFPGQTGLISVMFQPTATGTRSGNLLIDSSAGTLKVPLTATLVPQMTFDLQSLTLQALKGQTKPSKTTTTFTNTGSFGVGVISMSISGDTNSAFSQTNTCPSTLTGGSSCNITVSYVPSGAASDTAALVIVAGSISYSLPLIGRVTDFSLSGSTSSMTVSAGQTTTYPISLDTSGGYRGNLTFSCSGMPTDSTCTVTPASIVAGAGSTSVNAIVTTTARSSASIHWPITQYFGFVALAIGCALIRKRPAHNAFLLVLILSISVLSSCGGGGSGTGGSGGTGASTRGTPAGTYTLAVTAITPDGATRDVSLTLIVN